MLHATKGSIFNIKRCTLCMQGVGEGATAERYPTYLSVEDTEGISSPGWERGKASHGSVEILPVPISVGRLINLCVEDIKHMPSAVSEPNVVCKNYMQSLYKTV